jgi:hypothetical protein
MMSVMGMFRQLGKLSASYLPIFETENPEDCLVVVLKSTSVNGSRSFGLVFVSIVQFEVAQLVGYPVPEPLVASVEIVINEHTGTWQMREHLAAHSCGHMQVKHLRGIRVLPVRNKENAVGQDGGLHGRDLSAQQTLTFRRSPLNGKSHARRNDLGGTRRIRRPYLLTLRGRHPD